MTLDRVSNSRLERLSILVFRRDLRVFGGKTPVDGLEIGLPSQGMDCEGDQLRV